MYYDNLIYGQMMAEGIPSALALLTVAQARHESSNYTSNVFMQCNNLYGYKWVNQSTAAGGCIMSPEGDRYAMYNSIADSVHEIALWLKRRKAEGYFPNGFEAVTTAAQYASILQAAGFYGYSSSAYSIYLNGLTRALQLIAAGGLSAGPKAAGAGLLLIGGLAFLYRRELFGIR
jgi:uncharacterized FlgJ-related protein